MKLGGIRTESSSYGDSADSSEAKVFRAQCACENVVCVLKLLANQQTEGSDSLADLLVEGFQERSRSKIMDDPRRFTKLVNHEAVKIGDLGRVPRGSGPRRVGRTFGEVKKVFWAPSLTPPM